MGQFLDAGIFETIDLWNCIIVAPSKVPISERALYIMFFQGTTIGQNAST
jgi:hypothetical protein